jgi:hypothetical protein
MAQQKSLLADLSRIGGSISINGSFATFKALGRTFNYEFERGILTELLQDGSIKPVAFADVHKFLDELQANSGGI